MKILIYSYNYAPEPIGIAPLMTELAEGLAARGHQVHVLTGMPNYPQRRIYEGYRGRLYLREVKAGVQVDRCYVWIRPKPGLLGRMALDVSFVLTSLLRALGTWRPDVILYTSPPLAVCIPARVLGWLYRAPVVLSLQDILPEAAVHTGLITNAKAIRVFEAIERFAYASSDRIVAIAEGFVDNLRGKQVPAAKIDQIYNWVDTNFIRPLPKDNEFRAAHGLRDKFVVSYSGNIALTQGLETVIEAAALLKERPEAADIRFLVVGEERAIAQLSEYCRSRGAQDQVVLLPFQPREALPEMLAAADVGTIVQKHNVVAFNMPSKTQVLMASGRAILASVPDKGTAAAAVRASGGGLVVEPESPQAFLEGVLALYGDRPRTEAMGDRNRAFAEAHYSFATALDRYEATFERARGKG